MTRLFLFVLAFVLCGAFFLGASNSAQAQESGKALFARALGHEVRGEDDAAVRLYLRAIPILKAEGDKQYLADTYRALAYIAIERDAQKDAKQLYLQALELYKSIGNKAGEGRVIYDLAVMGFGRNFEFLGEASKEECRQLRKSKALLAKTEFDIWLDNTKFALSELGCNERRQRLINIGILILIIGALIFLGTNRKFS